MKVSSKQLVERAEAEIETLSVEAAKALLGSEDVLIVDLRDVRERKREGWIPGSFHMPRGMLEFWIDDESPYYKAEQFGQGKRIVFHCNKGWRSALATQTAQMMGLENCCHIGGGFAAWAEAGAPIETEA